MSEPLPVEPGIESSPQETQDIFRRESDRGVVEQPRIETSQRFAAGKDQVGRILRLIDDPIIAEAAKPSLVHQGINLPHQVSEDLRPVQIGEPISQFLSGLKIVQGREGVVLQSEPQPSLEHRAPAKSGR